MPTPPPVVFWNNDPSWKAKQRDLLYPGRLKEEKKTGLVNLQSRNEVRTHVTPLYLCRDTLRNALPPSVWLSGGYMYFQPLLAHARSRTITSALDSRGSLVIVNFWWELCVDETEIYILKNTHFLVVANGASSFNEPISVAAPRPRWHTARWKVLSKKTLGDGRPCGPLCKAPSLFV